jgi:hypothetical protein
MFPPYRAVQEKHRIEKPSSDVIVKFTEFCFSCHTRNIGG